MKRHVRLIGFLAICAVLMIPLGAMADSISPPTMSFSGSSTGPVIYHVTKTVNVSALGATQADIFFLSDTTGSMGGTINTVKSNAAYIMTQTAAVIGPSTAWGVGEYKDYDQGDPFTYKLDQAITTNQSLVQTGIDMWSASGGGDYYEANLYGVQQATTPDSGWRAGSSRVLVQFGDAPSKDPAGPPPGVTLADAESALTSTGTKLIAVDVGNKNGEGQETAMVAAAGGQYLPPGTSGDALVQAVINAITSSVSTYNTVSLKLVAPDGITVTDGLVKTGDWDRSVDRSFTFEFDLAGCCAALGYKDVDFEIQALVDGAVVATEFDHWTCAPVPVPPSLILLGSGLLGLIGFRRFKLH